MAVECGGNVGLGGRLPADWFALGAGGGHAGLHPGANHGELQLGEDARHLEKGLGHRVERAASAVHRDGAENGQAQALLLNAGDDFAELLGGARQAADLRGENRVAGLGGLQQHFEVLLDLRVAVFVFKDHLFRARGLQLADLALNVLFAFAGGAARVAVNHFGRSCQRKGRWGFAYAFRRFFARRGRESGAEKSLAKTNVFLYAR